MPLTLDQYATYLDSRDLPWPAPPKVDVPRVKPHLPVIPGIKAILWNVYGTLLSISGGDLAFESDNDFLMNVALDKTIHEFKMWASMSRKPGQPSEYMREIYRKVLDEQRLAAADEHGPEIVAEKVWESIIKKLFQKDYKFDATFFGSLTDYSKKVAYFFHASLQGTGCYEDTAHGITEAAQRGLVQGLLGNGQCFTSTQLVRGLNKQDPSLLLDAVMPAKNRILSAFHKAKKPSDTLFQAAIEELGNQGIEPEEILHVGSSLPRDLGPAKKWGMKTALMAGDRISLEATAEQLKDPRFRPDALLTSPGQIPSLLG
jgi:FMN phosphatase YigB (HAD superfamily)